MAAADEVERLYGLDPAEFVAERDAAAKRLRQEGDRAGARVIAGLRRPTAAAGMVNRVVRAAPDRVEELRGAADALAEAAGAGDPAALRAAATREREAVEALVKVARDLDPDLPQQALQHVRETLHAAAIDRELRDQALSGRLEKEVVAAGLGGLPAAGSLPAPRRRPAAAPPARERARPAREPATRARGGVAAREDAAPHGGRRGAPPARGCLGRAAHPHRGRAPRPRSGAGGAARGARRGRDGHTGAEGGRGGGRALPRAAARRRGRARRPPRTPSWPPTTSLDEARKR